MQLHLLTIFALIVSFYQVATEDEISSINADAPPSTTEEEFAKRYYEDANEGQQNDLILRTRRAQWRGGSYSKIEMIKLVGAHNRYRKGVSPASSDMNELLWSPALAEQAQTWSDGCYYEHPDKTQYTDYQGIGQNLYITWPDKGGKNPPPVTDPVDEWYDEVQDYNYNSKSCNPDAVCGHYTQVVWAKTTKVGCGITFCPLARSRTTTYENAWLVTCNYSPAGNMQGQFPYKSGERCSQCEKGFCMKNLCSKCKPNEKGCVCRMKCKNGGRMDPKKCQCKCAAGYYGLGCQERCEDKHEWCGASPGWPKSTCEDENFLYVPEKCPALCGLCKHAPGRGQ